MNDKEYKELSIKEFTKAATVYETDKAGILLKSLAESGNTVLVATHDPELIELCCDYVLCIENGRLGYMKRV